MSWAPSAAVTRSSEYSLPWRRRSPFSWSCGICVTGCTSAGFSSKSDLRGLPSAILDLPPGLQFDVGPAVYLLKAGAGPGRPAIHGLGTHDPGNRDALSPDSQRA